MSDDLATVPVQPGIADDRSAALMVLVERLDAIPLEGLLVYLIDTVDVSVLPHLVVQFDMGDFIRETTQEATTRAMLKEAINLKRRLGTAWAINFVATALGVPVEIIDWPDDPNLARHTFIARGWSNTATVALDAEVQAELQRLVVAAKRYSQHETVEMATGLDWPFVLAGALDPSLTLDIEVTANGRDGTTLDMGLGGFTDALVLADIEGAANGRDGVELPAGLGGNLQSFQLIELAS